MAQVEKVGKHATKIWEALGVTHVKYHDTVVVSFDSRHVTLNSGGYLTYTTKLRMNQASNQFDLGFQVQQKDGIWWVHVGNKCIEYRDNMSFLFPDNTKRIFEV